ncbi:MAG: hypothetical protein R3D67_04615 [Hyphomicrobiaceae bacterium]
MVHQAVGDGEKVEAAELVGLIDRSIDALMNALSRATEARDRPLLLNCLEDRLAERECYAGVIGRSLRPPHSLIDLRRRHEEIAKELEYASMGSNYLAWHLRQTVSLRKAS